MATIVSIRDIRWYIDGIWIPYPTINWWRHTTNILLDIVIHTEMWLCWVWGYARSMGGKISFNWWLAFYVTWREREDSIYTQQSTAIKRHNNILLIGYAIHVGMWVFCMRWSMGWKDITIRVCYCCQVYNVWGKFQMAGQDGGTITTKTGMLKGVQKLKRSEMSVLCDCIRSRRAINIADIIKDY